MRLGMETLDEWRRRMEKEEIWRTDKARERRTIYANVMITLALAIAIVFILGILYARAVQPTYTEDEWGQWHRQCERQCSSQQCRNRCIKRAVKQSKRYW